MWENYEKSKMRVCKRANFPIDDAEVKRPWGGDLNPKRGNDPEERRIAPAHRGSVCSSFVPFSFFLCSIINGVLSLWISTLYAHHTHGRWKTELCPFSTRDTFRRTKHIKSLSYTQKSGFDIKIINQILLDSILLIVIIIKRMNFKKCINDIN